MVIIIATLHHKGETHHIVKETANKGINESTTNNTIHIIINQINLNNMEIDNIINNKIYLSFPTMALLMAVMDNRG